MVNMIIGIVVAVIGLVMVIIPTHFLSVLILLLGLGATAYGIFALIKITSLSNDVFFKTTSFVQAIVSIIIGVLAVALPLATANAAVTICLYVLGVYLIAGAVSELMLIIKLKETGIDTKKMIFQTVGMLTIGILMFFLNSETLMKIILRIIGAVLIVCGGAFAFFAYRNRDIVVTPDSVDDAE